MPITALAKVLTNIFLKFSTFGNAISNIGKLNTKDRARLKKIARRAILALRLRRSAAEALERKRQAYDL